MDNTDYFRLQYIFELPKERLTANGHNLYKNCIDRIKVLEATLMKIDYSILQFTIQNLTN